MSQIAPRDNIGICIPEHAIRKKCVVTRGIPLIETRKWPTGEVNNGYK
jgi:hypothetical protein